MTKKCELKYLRNKLENENKCKYLKNKNIEVENSAGQGEVAKGKLSSNILNRWRKKD